MRFIFIDGIKIEGFSFLGGSEMFEDHWNSSVIKTSDPELFAYILNGEIVVDSFDNIPFRGYGASGH